MISPLHATILAGSALFRGVAAADVPERVCALGGAVRRFVKGAAVLREGESTHSLGVLLAGRLRLVRTDWDGNREIVADLAPGAIFAESFAVAPHPPLAVTVEAVAPAEVLFLDAARLAASDRASALLSILAGKNRYLNEKLSIVSRRRTREKVLAFLSAESRRAGTCEFEIPFDRQGLADYLAVDRSALSAELGRLRDEGVLSFRKNRFRLRTS